MVDSFAAHPYQFIQKPFSEKHIYEVMDDLISDMRDDVSFLDNTDNSGTYFTIKTDNICYIESTDSKSKDITYHMVDRDILTRGTLSQIEAELDDYRFVRCSRNSIVNLRHIYYIKDMTVHFDFTDYGRFTVISGKDRRGYWTSKCLWCILSVVIYYAAVLLVVTAGALIFGASFSLEFSSGIMENICSGVSYVTRKDMLIVGVAVPVIVNTAMCLLEMLLSFCMTPVVSFAVTAAYSIMGTYYTSPVFLGNFAMWLRSSYLTKEGVAPASGLILGFAVIAAVYLAGRQYFRKVDII